MSAPEDTDDDLLAAEYALGTLDEAERRTAAAREAGDPVFAARVRAWEDRLIPLSEGGPEQDAPSHVWEAIDRRLGPAPPAAADRDATIVLLRRQRAFWQRSTGLVGAALAASLVGLMLLAPWQARNPAPTLVAFLQPNGDAPGILIRADLHGRALAVRPVEATPPQGRSYELWIIDPQAPRPRSLGVLDGGPAARPLPADVDLASARRSTFAVTIEPPGGSSTGAPSGAPVFSGHLLSAGS